MNDHWLSLERLCSSKQSIWFSISITVTTRHAPWTCSLTGCQLEFCDPHFVILVVHQISFHGPYKPYDLSCDLAYKLHPGEIQRPLWLGVRLSASQCVSHSSCHIKSVPVEFHVNLIRITGIHKKEKKSCPNVHLPHVPPDCFYLLIGWTKTQLRSIKRAEHHHTQSH